jgi:hypothetical protein
VAHQNDGGGEEKGGGDEKEDEDMEMVDDGSEGIEPLSDEETAQQPRQQKRKRRTTHAEEEDKKEDDADDRPLKRTPRPSPASASIQHPAARQYAELMASPPEDKSKQDEWLSDLATAAKQLSQALDGRRANRPPPVRCYGDYWPRDLGLTEEDEAHFDEMVNPCFVS